MTSCSTGAIPGERFRGRDNVVGMNRAVPFKDEAATRPHRSGVAGSPNRNGPVLAKAAASPEDERYGRKEVVRQMSEQPATPEVAGC